MLSDGRKMTLGLGSVGMRVDLVKRKVFLPVARQ